MKLIAIGGLKNAGKDTMANMLQYCLSTPCLMHNYTWYRLFGKFYWKKYSITSFAYYLKTSLGEIIGVNSDKFNDRDFKENYYIYFPTMEITNSPPKNKIIGDKKFSRYLQSENFDFINNCYISIRQLLQLYGTNVIRRQFGDKLWILRTLNRTDNIIISDMRFKAEFEEVINKKGITIYIDRKGKPGNHASEREIVDLNNENKFHYRIDNTGTLKDLFYQTSKLVKLWQKQQ